MDRLSTIEADLAAVQQRVSFIEGRLDSVATKEDLSNLETRLRTEMQANTARILEAISRQG